MRFYKGKHFLLHHVRRTLCTVCAHPLSHNAHLSISLGHSYHDHKWSNSIRVMAADVSRLEAEEETRISPCRNSFTLHHIPHRMAHPCAVATNSIWYNHVLYTASYEKTLAFFKQTPNVFLQFNQFS